MPGGDGSSFLELQPEDYDGAYSFRYHGFRAEGVSTRDECDAACCKETAKEAARKLKQVRGTKIFALGLGSEIPLEYLQELTSDDSFAMVHEGSILVGNHAQVPHAPALAMHRSRRMHLDP